MPEGSKDYIINLRVSRDLYDKIKEQAKANRETVSNFIRKTVEDSAEFIAGLPGEIFGAEARFEDIIGYHEISAARQLVCAKCGMKIAPGDRARVGETSGSRKYFFCQRCPQG